MHERASAARRRTAARASVHTKKDSYFEVLNFSSLKKYLEVLVYQYYNICRIRPDLLNLVSRGEDSNFFRERRGFNLKKKKKKKKKGIPIVGTCTKIYRQMYVTTMILAQERLSRPKYFLWTSFCASIMVETYICRSGPKLSDHNTTKLQDRYLGRLGAAPVISPDLSRGAGIRSFWLHQDIIDR